MNTPLLIFCTSLAFSGCASRSVIHNDNPIKGVSNLYNRNFIVAAPTLLGNAVCGTPFILLSGAADALYPAKRTETYYSVVNGAYSVPASVCGAAIGTPFILFSYVCQESPWDFDFKFTRKMEWGCH